MTAELVERVVLLGAPVSINNENWEAARKVVPNHYFVDIFQILEEAASFRQTSAVNGTHHLNQILLPFVDGGWEVC